MQRNHQSGCFFDGVLGDEDRFDGDCSGSSKGSEGDVQTVTFDTYPLDFGHKIQLGIVITSYCRAVEFFIQRCLFLASFHPLRFHPVDLLLFRGFRKHAGRILAVCKSVHARWRHCAQEFTIRTRRGKKDKKCAPYTREKIPRASTELQS